jgi:putative membrane protein
MMWWNHGAWDVGDWLAMSLMMLVFWSLVAGGIVLLVRSLSDKPTRTDGDQRTKTNADDVLAERFARGDINEDEFTRRRALLHSTHAASRPSGGE